MPDRCGMMPETSRVTPDRCALGADGCAEDAGRKEAVGSKRQAVGRGRKENKFRMLGKKSAGKERPLPPIWAAPVRHPAFLGAKAEKAVKSRAVRNSIIGFPMNRELEPNYPLSYVKMLQFPKRVPGSWCRVPGPDSLSTAYCLLLQTVLSI
jgi:hypothetical protein